MYHKYTTFACTECGKTLPASMIYEYEGEDICWICLTKLQDEKDRKRLDKAFDNARTEQCMEGWG